jgi:hypothetical protein
MKWARLVLTLALTLALVFLCRQVIMNSTANQLNKYEYAELNHVRYGLLNVEEWKRQITEILSEEINKFNISKTSERELRGHLVVLLNTLIDKLAQQVREANSNSLGGWIRQTFISIFVNLDDIKKGIPDYANAIIHEMKKAKTRNQIKALLRHELEHFAKQTYEPQDTQALNFILQETGAKNIEGARLKVNQAISARQTLILRESVLMILLAIGLFGFIGLSRQPLTSFGFVLLVVSLVLLLVVGVTTPTIDVEARISELSFMVMGHPIKFENQVLYFQSKSLLDVFHLLIHDKDIQVKFVGVLLVTFSVIFPALKLMSSVAYFFNFRQARENPLIRFFVLKSGKWSMADVMVVAVFMAYIGFNGMINGVFQQMHEVAGKDLVMITTDGTALQPGYFVFLTYTLLALIFSGMITKKPRGECATSSKGPELFQ